jgi:hypothetical protein
MERRFLTCLRMCSALFSYPVVRRGLTKASQAHPSSATRSCVVLANHVDHLRLHVGHGVGVVVSVERAHLLVCLPARVPSSNPTASVATAP